MVAPPASAARLAELLGVLSLTTDLAAGVPVETCLRTCVVATRLGRMLGLDASSLSDAYYTSLLRHLGCTAFSHESASIAAGDDHDFLRTFEAVDPADVVAGVSTAVRNLARASSIPARVVAVGRALTQPGVAATVANAQCAQASALASDLGMSAPVVRALGQIYERFQGNGEPSRLDGDAIEPSARLLHVANLVEVHHRRGGRDAAVYELRRRRGGQLEPRIVDAFLAEPASFWPLLEAPSVWELYCDSEPGPARMLTAAGIEDVACAFGRYADMKVPHKIGHSQAVAELATGAAVIGQLAPADVTTLRLAAFFHDIGVAGVPNGVWEKPGPLNVVEKERVRLHAYYTERILSHLPSLAPVVAIVGDHERHDATGYPRAAATRGAPKAARLLACADVYEALVAPRSYRPAHAPAAAAAILRKEASDGRLCAWAVDCVLAAAGQAEAPRPRSPGGLTAREVDVVVELARGRTNKEIATTLGISTRTVKHHLEHVYAKVGVTTRSAAALFAARAGLLSLEAPHR